MSVISEIRNTAVEILKTANIAGGRIYNSRVTPTFLQNTPAVCVFTDQIQATQYDVEPPVFTRALTLQIEVVVANSSSSADDADSVVESVIDTLMSNAEWVAKFCTIKSYEVAYNYSGEADKPTTTALITIAGSLFKSY